MGAHAQLHSAPVGANPPEQNGHRDEEAGKEPPAALIHGRYGEAIGGRWGIDREPEELAHKLDGAVVHLNQVVPADRGKADEEEDDRGHTREAQVNGAELRIAEAADQV